MQDFKNINFFAVNQQQLQKHTNIIYGEFQHDNMHDSLLLLDQLY